MGFPHSSVISRLIQCFIWKKSMVSTVLSPSSKNCRGRPPRDFKPLPLRKTEADDGNERDESKLFGMNMEAARFYRIFQIFLSNSEHVSPWSTQTEGGLARNDAWRCEFDMWHARWGVTRAPLIQCKNFVQDLLLKTSSAGRVGHPVGQRKVGYC